MIFPQQDYNARVAARFQPIAGPFRNDEQCLFDAMVEHLRRSGARITTIRESRGDVIGGVSIYRLREQCETKEETRRRLKRHCKDSSAARIYLHKKAV